MCIRDSAAAAEALNLDFIPLYHEDFDLIVACEYYHNGFLDPVFELMSEPKFQQSISNMAGYDVSVMGEIVLDQWKGD